MGIISAIAGVVGASKQKKIAKRQARAAEAQAAAEKERQRIEQVRADVNARKERRQQLREARIRRAQVLSASANAGALGASTTTGAIGGINTQFGANIGQINEAQGFGQAISTQNEAAAAQQTEINRLEGKSQIVQAQTQLFQSIGNLGENIFQRAGGFTSLAGGNIFSR
jgi:hypothetical protein